MPWAIHAPDDTMMGEITRAAPAPKPARSPAADGWPSPTLSLPLSRFLAARPINYPTPKEISGRTSYPLRLDPARMYQRAWFMLRIPEDCGGATIRREQPPGSLSFADAIVRLPHRYWPHRRVLEVEYCPVKRVDISVLKHPLH